MKGMDTSAKLRSKRKSAVAEKEDTDEGIGKMDSKLVQILRRKRQMKKRTSESEDEPVTHSSEDDDNADAWVRQLDANMDLGYQRLRDHFFKGADTKHNRHHEDKPEDRHRDSARSRPDERPKGNTPSSSCQLGGQLGHRVTMCLKMCCSNCELLQGLDFQRFYEVDTLMSNQRLQIRAEHSVPFNLE